MTSRLFIPVFAILLTSYFSFSQSFLTPNKGQFFEQGYGQSSTGKGNEEGIDIVFDKSFNNLGGALMAGWVEDTTEHYETFGTDNMDAAVWRIGAFGKQRSHFSFQGQLFEAATGIINGPSNKYAICVRKSPTFNTTHTVDLEDSLLVYQFDSLGNVDFITRFGVVNENYRNVGIAPVDIIYEGGELGYLVLANRIRKIEDAANKIEPVLVRVSTAGNLDTLVAYTNDYSVEAHELYKDQDNTIHFSANCFATTTYPKLIGYSNGLSNTFDYSYTGLSSTQVFGLAKHNFGYYAMAGYQYGESDTNAVVVVLDGDYAYDETWIAGEDHLTETFRDLNTHGEGIIAIGLRQSDSELGIGEGKKDVFICHFDNQGEITLEETMGSHKNDRVTHTEPHPLQPATFFAGNHTGYGKDSTGNAYLGGVLFYELESLFSGSCKVPRVLWVDEIATRPEEAEGIILGNKSKEDSLIQFAVDNEITSLALYNLGLIFDTHNDTLLYIYNSKLELRDSLKSFIKKCAKRRIEVGMVTDTTDSAQINASLYNTGLFNYEQESKINFIVLEHEFWNANSLITNSGNTTIYDPITNPVPQNLMNDHFENVWNDHKVNLLRLNKLKHDDGNMWRVQDYVAYYFHNWNNINNSYWHTNTDSARAKAIWIDDTTDVVYLYYYQNDQDSLGLDFLKNLNPNDFQSPRFRERLNQLGYAKENSVVYPMFSGEYYTSNTDLCGYVNGSTKDTTDFLGRFLYGPPANTGSSSGTFYAVETEYINQHTTIYNDVSNYPEIEDVEVNGFAWFKYSCLELKNFPVKSRVSCPSFSNLGLTTKGIN